MIPSIRIGLVILLLLGCLVLKSQTYQVGQSYFDENEHAEYIHGNLPLILSAPHGGELKPSNIPDRNCAGCVYVNDSYTQELAREIADKIEEKSGCYPHIIINKLHRIKLDANRAIEEAADGNAIAEQAWENYHGFVDTARNYVTQDFGKGLFLDLHGHAHVIQRLELGYLLSKNDLQLADIDLEELIEKSSIKNLALNHPNLNFHELVRGDQSFGALIYEADYDAVPSDVTPYPDDAEPYFSGGYNTLQYGSKNEGQIDAIQIECHQDVRFVTSFRQRFADSLATVILKYLDHFYVNGSSQSPCQIVTTTESQNTPWKVFPNPFNEFIHVQIDGDLKILDYLGRNVKIIPEHRKNEPINLQMLPAGIYRMIITNNDKYLHSKNILKL